MAKRLSKRLHLRLAVEEFVEERYRGVQLIGGYFDMNEKGDLDELLEYVEGHYLGVAERLDRMATSP